MDDPDLTSYLPEKLPVKWSRVPRFRLAIDYPNVAVLGLFKRDSKGHDSLNVLMTADYYEASEPGLGWWLHLSIGRKSRMPSYDDVSEAKALFFGDLRIAVQLYGPARLWLHRLPNCVHLFSRLVGQSVPDVLWTRVGAGWDGTLATS